MTDEISVGVQFDKPFSEYLKINAMNCSTLKKVSQSPAHAVHQLNTPHEPTASMVIGDALHAAILEPERFDLEYALALDRPKRSKADKEAWQEWYEAHPDVTALKADDFMLVKGMQDSILSHATANEIMVGNGVNEVTMAWLDPETGYPCKGRADRMTEALGANLIVDLKTTQDGSPHGFGTQIARFGYDQQAAWYLGGAWALAPIERRFLFVCVENKAPHGVSIQELHEDDVANAAKLNQLLLKRWINCLETEEFVGYPQHVVKQRVPAWRRQEIDRRES